MAGDKGMCVHYVKQMSVSLALRWLNGGFVIVDLRLYVELNIQGFLHSLI